MTDPTIKNCSTCGHSTPGDYRDPERQNYWRFCNLCGEYCKTVNFPIFQNYWNCKAQNQWVPQPPTPSTLWQQIGKAILAKLTPGDSK
jgi:hypothetical protein